MTSRVKEKLGAVMPADGWLFGYSPPPVSRYSLATRAAAERRLCSVLASLPSTCRRHDLDPQLYLTQLLINLPTTRMSELSA